jgi:hypothetical protein
MKFLSGVLFLGLMGCASTNKIIGPDGTENLMVRCLNVEGCYSDAREQCGGNYQIVNTTTESNNTTNGIFTMQNMLIKCEGATAPAAPTKP